MSRKTTALKHRSWNVFKNFIMAQPGRLRIECVKDVLLKMILETCEQRTKETTVYGLCVDL